MTTATEVSEEMRLRAALRDSIQTLSNARRSEVWEIVNTLLAQKAVKDRTQQLRVAMAMLDSVMRKPYSDSDLSPVMLTLIDIRDGLERLTETKP